MPPHRAPSGRVDRVCAPKGEKYIEFPSNTWDRVLKHATKLAKDDAIEKARDAGATEEEALEAGNRVPPIKGGPHRARHTFASHFLAAKPDLFLLGKLLGHSHTRVTELYSHLIPEHLAEARNVVSFATEAASAAGTVTKGEPRKTIPGPSLKRRRAER
jgi:integrase